MTVTSNPTAEKPPDGAHQETVDKSGSEDVEHLEAAKGSGSPVEYGIDEAHQKRVVYVSAPDLVLLNHPDMSTSKSKGRHAASPNSGTYVLYLAYRPYQPGPCPCCWNARGSGT